MKKSIAILLILSVPIFLFSQNGNIGIGKKNPEEKLHVAGKVKVDSLAGPGERLIVADQFGTLKAIDPDQSLVLRNAEGQVRFILNPDKGSFELLLRDTVRYSIQLYDTINIQDIYPSDEIDPRIDRFLTLHFTPSQYSVNKDGNAVFSDGINSVVVGPQGNILSSHEYTANGSAITKDYYEDGTLKNFIAAYSDNSTESQAYYPSGKIKIDSDTYANGDQHYKTYGEDGTLHLWIKNGKQIYEYKADDGTVYKEEKTSKSEAYTKYINSDYTSKLDAQGVNLKNGNTQENNISSDGISVKDGEKNSTLTNENLTFVSNTAKSKMDGNEVMIEYVDDKIIAINPAGITITDINNGQTLIMYFEGDKIRIAGNMVITGSLSVNGTKNFVIDHPLDPENKLLYHHAIESNEVINQYSGNITTNEFGKATVILPDYFEALNKDFRYHLTVINSFSRAMVSKKISNNQFEIRTEEPDTEVSWMVSSVRNDQYMKDNPPRSEELKKK